MKESLKSTLAELTAIDGVAGFEQDVVQHLQGAFAGLADRVEVDRMGNLYATREGDANGPSLMLAAHSDEIGAMVKSIDLQGFLRFDTLGRTVDSMLLGRRVRVRGHLGVIGVKSGHLQTSEEAHRVPVSDELYVDVGANSAEAVADMGIAVGDPIAYYSPLVSLTGGDRVCGKAIDDRIGCAILLELFKRLEGVSVPGTVHACVCVQEEIGFRGAQVAAYRLEPDYALVVDTFMAGGTPDMDYYKELPATIGDGPVLLLANSGQIGHPAVNRYLRAAADEAGVNLQPCTIVGKAGTDATTIHTAREGVPTAGLGLARRYSHTPVCVLDLNDARGAVEVLGAFVLAMGSHTDLGFLS